MARFISFGVLGNTAIPIWCDNEICIMVSKDSSSEKRLAYMARRVRFMQELVARGVITLHKVPGTANPADALTKYIGRDLHRDYMARLYQAGPSDM